MIHKCGSRVRALPEYLAVGAFDGHPARSVKADFIGSRETRHLQALVLRDALDNKFFKRISPPFTGKKGACHGHVNGETLQPLPPIQAAACLHGVIKQSHAKVSEMSDTASEISEVSQCTRVRPRFQALVVKGRTSARSNARAPSREPEARREEAQAGEAGSNEI
jgi:hypothetical protein